MTQDYLPKLTQIEGAKLYAQVSKDVTEAGILERDYSFYSLLTLIAVAGFFTSLFFLVKANSLIGLILWAFPFSFFTVQIGGLMHDAGHLAIFKSVKSNNIAGLVCGGLIASMFSSWKLRHNEHHAHPNNIETDEDVLDFPFFSFSEDRIIRSKGIFRRIMKHQTLIYYPIQSTFSFAMRVSFAVTYFQKNKIGGKALEMAIYLAGIFIWFVLPFIIFGPIKGFLLFFLPTVFTGFYMANIFAPNHKGMPLLKKGLKISFFEEQLITTRNINPNPIIDFVYMGLNYQIEHHLFPSCPRNRLKLITPYVEKACRQSGIKFSQIGIVQSNKVILQELKRVSLIG